MPPSKCHEQQTVSIRLISNKIMTECFFQKAKLLKQDDSKQGATVVKFTLKYKL